MVAGIIKKRLLGSVLLLLIMMVPVVFLTYSPSHNNEKADAGDNNYRHEIGPSPPIKAKQVRDDKVTSDSKPAVDDRATDKEISTDHAQKQTVTNHQQKNTDDRAHKKQTTTTKLQHKIAKPTQSWVIQLGSFKVEKNARALHEKITKMGGFNVSMKQKNDYYVVRIVIQADRQDVDKQAALLAEKFEVKPKVFLTLLK